MWKKFQTTIDCSLEFFGIVSRGYNIAMAAKKKKHQKKGRPKKNGAAAGRAAFKKQKQRASIFHIQEAEVSDAVVTPAASATPSSLLYDGPSASFGHAPSSAERMHALFGTPSSSTAAVAVAAASSNNNDGLTSSTSFHDQRRPCFVYCLASTGDSPDTYIGATINLRKRLRQHCGELVNGAKKTTSRSRLWKWEQEQQQKASSLSLASSSSSSSPAVNKWYMVRYVSGFPTWRAALQFEYKWQKLSCRTPTLAGRYRALEKLLKLSKPSVCGMEFAAYAHNGGHWPRIEGPLHLDMTTSTSDLDGGTM